MPPCSVKDSFAPFKPLKQTTLRIKLSKSGLAKFEWQHHQNYCSLCPNHAALFGHTNGSKENMKDLFLSLANNRLELTLADQSTTGNFTDTHIQDNRTGIEVDDES